jgi:hypothetical protein
MKSLSNRVLRAVRLTPRSAMPQPPPGRIASRSRYPASVCAARSHQHRSGECAPQPFHASVPDPISFGLRIGAGHSVEQP